MRGRGRFFRHLLPVLLALAALLTSFLRLTLAPNPALPLQRQYFEFESTVRGFPRLEPDGRYRLPMEGFIIVSSNAGSFYPGCRVKGLGYFTPGRLPRVSNPSVLEKLSEGPKTQLWILNLRRWGERQILKSPHPENRALLFGIAMGNPSFLDYETLQSFRITGLSHLLAISGLNVALIAAVLVALLSKFTGRRKAYLISVVVIALYAALSGFQASACRAALMFALFAWTRSSGRNEDLFPVLLLSMALLFFVSPGFISDVGFWLSYTAVLGLYFLAEPIGETLHFLPGFLRENLSVTLAANIGTLPILVFVFHGVSLLSPVANILVIPFFNLLTGLAMLEFVLLPLVPPALLLPLEIFIRLLFRISKALASWLSYLPSSFLKLSDIPEYFVFPAYLLLCFLLVFLFKRKSLFSKISIRRIKKQNKTKTQLHTENKDISKRLTY